MTRKTTPADVEVSPRDIHFDASLTNSGHWLDGDPVATAVFNALSLTFPDGERLFMDAVRHYRDRVSGKLAEDVRGFIAQAIPWPRSRPRCVSGWPSAAGADLWPCSSPPSRWSTSPP